MAQLKEAAGWANGTYNLQHLNDFLHLNRDE
jgi:hypothetical protein